jgi:hypothetical protein
MKELINLHSENRPRRPTFLYHAFKWMGSKVCHQSILIISLPLYIVSNFECAVPLVISFRRTSKFIICSLDPRKCIYTDNICNKKILQILFPQFVREAKHKTLSTHLVERGHNIKYCVFKKHTTLL